MKKKWKILCFVLVAFGLLYFYNRYDITTEEILSWQPENTFFTALILLCCFAVKSALVFVPIVIPQILAGHIYSRNIAIFINLLGLVIVMAVPYWIGKRLGSVKMGTLVKKYPRIKNLLDVQENNQTAFCFMLRACAVPPADIVTMYLGATGMPFITNVICGVLGCFPGMILTTYLGANIRDPKSPAFWQALALNLFWIILSGIAFYLYKKMHSRKVVSE